MKKRILFKTGILAFLSLAILFTSCKKDDETPIDEIAQMVDEVRASTQDYESHSQAMAAGWDTDLSGCVEHPTEGGMGHHFARLEYFDGRINHLEPQILLYAPDANGDMEFVAVEYVIPFAILPEDSTPPQLFDMEYHQNFEQDIWALHLWTEKENPSGMFNDWNPNVSCN